MTALIIVTLFLLSLFLVYSKKGQEFIEAHKSWLSPTYFFFTALSLILLASDLYKAYEYDIWKGVIEVQSDARRMLIFTLWSMLSIKSLSGKNKEYLISNAFMGLLVFSGSFQMTMVILGLFTSFLPNQDKAQKISKRIMFLLISAVLVISTLSLTQFTEGDALYLLSALFIVLLKFNYTYESSEKSVFPALVFALISGVYISGDYTIGRTFYSQSLLIICLGALMMAYDYITQKKTGLFTLLPSLILIIVSCSFNLNLYSNLFVMLPLFWLYMIKDKVDIESLNKAEKFLYLLLFFTVGLTPFTPGGWALNMIWSEFVTKGYQFIYLIPLMLAMALVISFGLLKVYYVINTELTESETSTVTISKIISTIIIIGLGYYFTVPDIFSDSASFILLEHMDSKLDTNSIPWRSKNLIFLFSILLPILIFAAIYWIKRNDKIKFDKAVKLKLKVDGFIKGRMPFLENGIAVRSHDLSVSLRNRSELLLKGIMLAPTVFSIEVVASFGSLLGRMRPKGINSNLLYSIIVISLLTMFYLRLLL